MVQNSVAHTKAKAFAVRIIRFTRYLEREKHEFTLSKQILRSGTSIGANVKEAVCAQSKPDFYAKLYISLKETSETEYWSELLHESGYIENNHFESIYNDCKELLKLLTAITKTAKQ
jgi:four helix bundle protein